MTSLGECRSARSQLRLRVPVAAAVVVFVAAISCGARVVSDAPDQMHVAFKVRTCEGTYNDELVEEFVHMGTTTVNVPYRKLFLGGGSSRAELALDGTPSGSLEAGSLFGAGSSTGRH